MLKDAGGFAPHTPGKVVLVVEDDREIRESVHDLLQLEGYRVHLALNGQEALDSLESGLRPSLILLDLMLPVMDGWSFLDRIRSAESYAGIPVVVFSAVRDDRAKQTGAVAVLRKPIKLDDLLTAVENHLKQ